jgi:hypothetical protein
MSRSTDCPKCGGSMASGFVLGYGNGTKTPATWVEGEPVKTVWTGLNLRGRKQVPITTWRCGRCGYLESYAQ